MLSIATIVLILLVALAQTSGSLLLIAGVVVAAGDVPTDILAAYPRIRRTALVWILAGLLLIAVAALIAAALAAAQSAPA